MLNLLSNTNCVVVDSKYLVEVKNASLTMKNLELFRKYN